MAQKSPQIDNILAKYVKKWLLMMVGDIKDCQKTSFRDFCDQKKSSLAAGGSKSRFSWSAQGFGLKGGGSISGGGGAYKWVVGFRKPTVRVEMCA